MRSTASVIDRPRALWQAIGLFAAVAVILVIAYWPTILRQPAGSDDPFLEDAGEFQVALNVWGTVHGTGYPLYTIAGNSFVHAARLIGVDPAVAPSLFSLACGLIALATGYAIVLRLTNHPAIAAVAMLILGLTRATWAYDVFPKTYSFSLIFYFGLFAVAVWPSADRSTGDRSVATPLIDPRRRVWWLALIGGVAVAHHRLLAFILPGLLIAVLPDLWRWFRSGRSGGATGRRRAITLIGVIALCVPLAALGFIPYLYLPLRALAHGIWVYGDPGTPIGFWREFTAVEANYLFTTAPTITAWLASARDTLAIVPQQLTWPGLIVLLPLATWGMYRRYEARLALLCAFPLLIFVLIWPRAVVAQAVIQPIVGFLVIAAALGLGVLADFIQTRQPIQAWIIRPTILVIGAIGASGLFMWSFADLSAISHETLGVQEIAIAARAPIQPTSVQGATTPQSIFVLPWGMRYSAVAFAHDVLGAYPQLQIADHNRLSEVLGNAAYAVFTDKDSYPLLVAGKGLNTIIESPAADVVQFSDPSTVPQPFDNLPRVVDHIVVTASSLTCQNDAQGDRITLHVSWGLAGMAHVTTSYSVFAHLVGTDTTKVLATGDQGSPVYGLLPTTQWRPGGVVEDSYPIDRQSGAVAVQFGLYQQPQPGVFVNDPAGTLRLADYPGCS